MIIKNHISLFITAMIYIVLIILGKQLDYSIVRYLPFFLNGLLIIMFCQILLKLPIKLKSTHIPTLLQCILALIFTIILRKINYLSGFTFASALSDENLAKSLEFLTGSILFIIFIVFVGKKIIVDFKLTKLAPQFKILVNYLIAFIVLHANLIFIKNVITNTHPLNEIGFITNGLSVFLSNWVAQFISISAIDISLLASFYFISESFRKYHVKKSHGQKIIYFLLCFIIFIPLQTVLKLNIPLIGLFLGTLILFVLIDIYLDQKYMDITWGFIWVFVMCIHVSSLIVFFNAKLASNISPVDMLNIYCIVTIFTILCLSILYCCNILLSIFDKYPAQYKVNQLSFRNKILTLNLSIVIFVIMSMILACFLMRDILEPSIYYLFNRIFVLTLLGTLIISLIANSFLTKPFIEIKHYISELGLKKNKTIEWTSSRDEIYDLVTAYNQAIVELEESAAKLARTERETAWKEMAKQVAHEIKNPLTPMKLSLQHLQKKIKNSEDVEAIDLVDKVSKTLIAQIDNLTRISNSFSNFSRLPKPQMEKVVLNELLSNVHNLFNNQANIRLHLYVPIDDVEVVADMHQLIQVLNNLVKNAIQALNDDNTIDAYINIRLYRNKNNAIIQVEDNGPGIAEDVRDKVFSPNFTTKNSGTGLGLAICHKIIESHNGKIYFDTNKDKGTVFIVVLKIY